jgi:hypothetical protein
VFLAVEHAHILHCAMTGAKVGCDGPAGLAK